MEGLTLTGWFMSPLGQKSLIARKSKQLVANRIAIENHQRVHFPGSCSPARLQSSIRAICKPIHPAELFVVLERWERN